MQTTEQPQSPYGVAATSVIAAPSNTGDLLPFEKDAVKYLLNQVNAASPRVRQALLAHPQLLVT